MTMDSGRVHLAEQERAFLVARSEAIQAYANLEQNLCELFSHLSDTNPVVAGTIFFRLSNSNSRLAILAALLRLKHKTKHNPFWNSVEKLLKPLDGRRNEVVHWHMAVTIDEHAATGTLTASQYVLAPPNFWARTIDTPEITVGDLATFRHQCGWLSDAVRLFVDHLEHRTILGRPTPSPDTFLQPLAYPTEVAPPTPRKRKASDTPPQS